MTTLSVEIDDETRSALAALADSQHQTIEAVVQNAITRLIRQEKEFREDDERWADCMKNGGIDAADVVNWLDQWAKGNRQPCPQ